ncbi:MAG TPA: aminoglycoside phosphotransferase family protein [Chloroflexia bacterium]|nr:aminoglycoside phosphotransferase family protein [Chloroflexia bacterium]
MSENPIYHDPDLTYNFHLIIPHPGEPMVLMAQEGDSWLLPHFHPQEHYFSMVGHINREVKRQVGIDATVLRCANVVRDKEVKKTVDAVFTMENHSGHWSPPGGLSWVGLAKLAELPMARPEQRDVIEEWLLEASGGEVPPLRAPWSRRGWLGMVREWIGEELEKLGLAPTGPIEQVKHWGISAVLRVPTSEGYFYFKAVPSLFKQEPAITQALARRYPGLVPMPVAVATLEEQGWMLLRDFGGEPLENATIGQYEEVVARFSHIQVESVDSVDELLTSGCADRRLARLRAQIDPSVEDVEVVSRLSGEELEKLRALSPSLKEMCDRLAGYRVPETLVHGDFYFGNMVSRDGEYIIFDWTDGCITHPFFDLLTLFEGEENLEYQARISDVYFAAWTAYEPVGRLREAYRLVETLGALHHAISYKQIVYSLEPSQRWELEGALPMWLRQVIASVEKNGARLTEV